MKRLTSMVPQRRLTSHLGTKILVQTVITQTDAFVAINVLESFRESSAMRPFVSSSPFFRELKDTSYHWEVFQ